jgi:hypothetical protein
MKKLKTFKKLFENENVSANNPEVTKIIDAVERESGGEMTPEIYSEKRDVDGFEINSYTNGGVNMIIFIDLRDEEVTYDNFAKHFKKYAYNLDVDSLIDMHRQEELYRNNFSISKSLEDFNSFKAELKEIADKL